jgi:hypothetical protein
LESFMNMGITLALTAGLQQRLLEEGCAVSIGEPQIDLILTELQNYQYENRDGKAKMIYHQASLLPENAVTGPSRVVEMIQNNLNSLVKVIKIVQGKGGKRLDGKTRVWKVKKIGRKEKADKLIDDRGGIGLWTDDPALLGNDIQEDAKMPAKKTSSHEHDDDPQQTPKNDPTKKRSKQKESVGEMKEEDQTEKLDEEDKNRNQEEEQPAANETPQAPETRQNEQKKQQKKRKGVENEDSIASKKSSRAKTPPKRFC